MCDITPHQSKPPAAMASTAASTAAAPAEQRSEAEGQPLLPSKGGLSAPAPAMAELMEEPASDNAGALTDASLLLAQALGGCCMLLLLAGFDGRQ